MINHSRPSSGRPTERGRGGGRGRGREGRGGRHPGRAADKDAEKDIRLSKSLSNLLRHRAFANGLDVSKDGFVDGESLLRVLNSRGGTNVPSITFEDVKRVVSTNDKQRFAIEITTERGWRIRANQGHTGAVADAIDDELLLVPILDPTNDCPTAVHGTYFSSVGAIAAQGLSRMARAHVHLALCAPERGAVISGMRASCDAVVHVDVAAAALEGGLNFYRSANGVILSPGDGDGFIPARFITRIERRADGASYDSITGTFRRSSGPTLIVMS